MNIWQKLTVDWPCALGDFLLANIVVPILVAHERLTFQRMIYVAALMLAVITFAQIVSFDVAFWAAGDVAFYCELTSVVIFIVAKGHVGQLFQTVVQKLRVTAARGFLLMKRCFGAMRHRRNANAMRRHDGPSNTTDSDYEVAAGIDERYAFA